MNKIIVSPKYSYPVFIKKMIKLYGRERVSLARKYIDKYLRILCREGWVFSVYYDNGGHCCKEGKLIGVSQNTETWLFVSLLTHEVGHAIHNIKDNYSSKEAFLKTRIMDEVEAFTFQFTHFPFGPYGVENWFKVFKRYGKAGIVNMLTKHSLKELIFCDLNISKYYNERYSHVYDTYFKGKNKQQIKRVLTNEANRYLTEYKF